MSSEKRYYQMSKASAIHLANILSDLTPQRVGSNEEFLFLTAIVADITETFPKALRHSEQGGNISPLYRPG